MVQKLGKLGQNIQEPRVIELIHEVDTGLEQCAHPNNHISLITGAGRVLFHVLMQNNLK